MTGTNSQQGSSHAAVGRWVEHFLMGIALFMLAPVAGAGELSVLINGWTKHTEERPGVTYNERNWGGGFQYDYETADERWRPFVTTAGFKDSERNMSYYAGGGIMRHVEVTSSFSNVYVDIGLVAFVMTRKTYKDNDPFLGALPAVTIGNDHMAVNITYIPKVDPKSVPVWFFQLKIPFSTF